MKRTFSINSKTNTLKKITDIIDVYKKVKNTLPEKSKILRKTGLKENEFFNYLYQLKDKSILEWYRTKQKSNPRKRSQKISFIEKYRIFILKSIIFCIGFIAFMLSIYFTYLWFLNMLSGFKSFLLSIAMVGFSVMAFESILLFKKNKQNILVVIFCFLWFTVVCFSMSTTLSGQLNLEFKKQLDHNNVSTSDNNNLKLYESYSGQIEDNKVELKSVREEREKLQEFISKSTNFDKEYKNLNYRIYVKNNQIKNYKSEIIKLESKKEDLLKNNTNTEKLIEQDFFSWVSDLFSINKNFLKFILFLAPALFLDIIAPLSFALVLFYKEKAP